MRKYRFQSGLTIIPVIIVVALMVVVGSGTFYYFNVSRSKSSQDNPFKSQSDYATEREQPSAENHANYKGQDKNFITNDKTNPYLGVPCESNPKVQFTNDFTEVDKIKIVEPTIVTPGNSRHRAWLDIDTAKTDKVAVYAPVDSELVNGVYKNSRGALDYDLHFQVSCEVWYLINHVTEPVAKIKKAFPSTPQIDTKIGPPFKVSIKIKAGELLGYSSGIPTAHNFDFGVFNLNHVNEGLPADEGSNYGKERNFICPFDLLPEQIKRDYYSKIMTSEKPYSNCEFY